MSPGCWPMVPRAEPAICIQPGTLGQSRAQSQNRLIVTLPYDFRPPMLISSTIPPGGYLTSSESASPPFFLSQTPSSDPSRLRVTIQVSSLVGLGMSPPYCSGGCNRPLQRHLDDVEGDPFRDARGPEENLGVNLPGRHRVDGV